jgi:hypothetical protein
MGNGYSLHKACPELKEIYTKCEKEQWQHFRETGDISNPCRDVFEDYRKCVMDVMDAKMKAYEARTQGTSFSSTKPAESSNDQSTNPQVSTQTLNESTSDTITSATQAKSQSTDDVQ